MKIDINKMYQLANSTRDLETAVTQPLNIPSEISEEFKVVRIDEDEQEVVIEDIGELGYTDIVTPKMIEFREWRELNER